MGEIPIRYKKEIGLAVVILLSFAVGCGVPCILKMDSGNYAALLSQYSLWHVQDTQRSQTDLLLYIFNIRIRTLLFLWMSSFTPAGWLFHYFWAAWLSMSAGMMLLLLILREGTNGGILFICCMFPQWIFYTWMWEKEIRQMSKRNRSLRILAELLLICMAGVFTEAYLGQWTMRTCLRLFQ